jgi:hypothetical protein
MAFEGANELVCLDLPKLEGIVRTSTDRVDPKQVAPKQVAPDN